MKECKVSRELVKGRTAWKLVIRNHLAHEDMEDRRLRLPPVESHLYHIKTLNV